LMICFFVLIEFTNVTDTHRQTPHDDIGRACMASRGNKTANRNVKNTVCRSANSDMTQLGLLYRH